MNGPVWPSTRRPVSLSKESGAKFIPAKFIGDAKESFNHAQLVGEKIVALGGVPVATRNEIKQSRVLKEVLEFSLAFESKAVEMYSQAIDMAEGNKPLVIFLEDILAQEQEGVDEYTKLLRDSGGPPPPADGPPRPVSRPLHGWD